MFGKIAKLFRKSAGKVKNDRGSIFKGKEERVAGKNVKRGSSSSCCSIKPSSFGKKEVSMMAKDMKRNVNFSVRAPEASRVLLTGSFNSWKESGLPMRRSKDGIWTIGMKLDPGRYEYKFIVDGQWWTDPDNANTIMNALGSLNSVREI